MFTVSQTAIQSAIRDIQNGVEYPDFWADRSHEDEQVQEEQTEEKKYTEEKEYAKMQDGEIVPVYAYHYTGTVNVWTENGIEQR